jgi:hypothetical protein
MGVKRPRDCGARRHASPRNRSGSRLPRSARRRRGARELAQILLEKNIPFDYMQMPGAHNSAYWIQSVGHIMSVQYEVMQRALGQRPLGRAAAAAR